MSEQKVAKVPYGQSELGTRTQTCGGTHPTVRLGKSGLKVSKIIL